MAATSVTVRRHPAHYTELTCAYATWQDLRLIHAVARHRDVLAFAELHRRVAAQAIALARTITKTPEDASDAFQEAMTRIWLSASTFRTDRVGPWIRKIVIRESLKVLHRKKRSLCKETLNVNQIPAQQSTPGTGAEQKELHQKLHALIKTLSNKDQVMLSLYFEGGCSQDAIAEQLAIPQRTVSNKLKTILNQFRSHFTTCLT